jgi:D-glucuronyl C5-epimerase C-terminus/Putative peptidoglycan binding domain
VTRSAADAPFIFADDDFAWDDDAFPGPQAPRRARSAATAARPPAPRPRRRPRRTLKSDLAGLGGSVPPRLASLPLTPALAAAGCIVAVVLVLLVLGPGGGSGGPEQSVEAAAPPPAAASVSVTAEQAPLGNLSSLGPGDGGPMVRGLQAALGALGLFAYVPDGGFGEVTAAAVTAFQSEHELDADGVVGTATADALRAALAERARDQGTEAARWLDAAVRNGLVPAAAGKSYRATLDASLSDVASLPLAEGGYLALAIQTVAAHAPDYDRPRALALFSMLASIRRHVAAHALPPDPRDLVGEDGVVYRFFPQHGFQFHPLASFVRLNGLAKNARPQQAARLTDALLARSVPVENALTWEYYFPYGGPPRWTSGLAQAVAAQALARSGALLEDPKLGDMARAAYRAIPAGLARKVADGLWIREYGFSDTAILNAQLQSIVSLFEYVEITGDERARALASRLAAAAKTLLPQFDTGCWSLYALQGNDATPKYHAYHVSLLGLLAESTGEAIWRSTEQRWDRFQQAGGSPGACA